MIPIRARERATATAIALALMNLEAFSDSPERIEAARSYSLLRPRQAGSINDGNDGDEAEEKGQG